MGTPWPPRGPDDIDDDQRARIRYQVLSALRGRTPTVGDRVYDAFALLALPTPHVVRALLVATLLAGGIAGATVASADSLPDEPLYGVKLASEELRLALATTAVDRAAVELSMAEHRLAEAEQLALGGRDVDALVATSTYGAHLANAAAALATIERREPGAGPVLGQLKQRLAEQQLRAAQVAARLADDPAAQAVAPVFQTVASIAPSAASGVSIAEQIAEHAASVTERLAATADAIAQRGAWPATTQSSPGGAEATTAAAHTASPVRGRASQAPRSGLAPEPNATLPRAVPERTEPAPRISARPAPDAAAAHDGAEKARHEAEKAREAAEKAKQSARQAAGPKATPER